MFCVTEEGIRRQNEAVTKAYRPYIQAGHAAEAPPNVPGRPRASAAGEIAVGREAGAGFHAAAMDAQAQQIRLPWQSGVQGDGPMAGQVRGHRPTVQGISGADATMLTQSTAGAPMASSYHDHAGAVTVAHTGVAPGQPPEHVAPTGVGARFRQNVPQAAARTGATYLPGPIGGSY